jgi:hypothetical protein
VDVGPPTRGEPQQYAVYDYKSGEGVSPRNILEGRDFQMPFYVLGVRAAVLAGQEPLAECVRWAYYKYRRPVGLGKIVKTEPTRHYVTISDYLAAATENARAHVRSIRAGRFPVAPQVCSSFCDFADICRYASYRAERKQGGEGA